MEVEKIEIKNRRGEAISILIEGKKCSKTVVLLQGMGETKEEISIQAISDTFQEYGYTTIRFDTIYTLEKHPENYQNFTTSNYYESLEDVIAFLKEQDWISDAIPFVGRSLGGLCSVLYAINHPSEVKAVFPVSTTISSNFSLEIFSKELLNYWEQAGILEWEDQGIVKRLKWDFVIDSKQFDVLKQVERLTAPVFMISAEKDKESTLKHQGILFNMIPGTKCQKIIQGAPHKIKEQHHLEQIKNAFEGWIPKLEL